MKGIFRLIILTGIALIGGYIISQAAYSSIQTLKIDDLASRATIVTGVTAFFGTIFTTIYKEISSYYKDKTARATRRWNLVYPLITEHYMSWITSADSLDDAFKRINFEKIEDSHLNRILYLFAVFYGERLRFILKNGGYILLSSTKESAKINDLYNNIKSALQWAGSDTPRRVSELQKIFVEGRKNGPYVLDDFVKELEKCSSIQESREILRKWITKEKSEKIVVELENFSNTFKKSIDKLSTAWDS